MAGGDKTKRSIYRNYYDSRHPYYLNGRASDIMTKVRRDARALKSKRSQKDADKLTEFFQALKNWERTAPTETANDLIINKMIKNLGEENFKQFTGLVKFDKSGTDFEGQLENLFAKDATNAANSIKGTSVASGVLVKKTFDSNKYTNYAGAIKGDIGNDIREFEEGLRTAYVAELKNKVVNIRRRKYAEEKDGVMKYYVEVRLEVGALRQGKVDVSGKQLAYSLVGTQTPDMKRIEDLLSHSTFSVKSYEKEKSSIHLGNTNPLKAVTSICSYASKVKGASSVARFYIRHAGPDGLVSHPSEDPSQIENINERYVEMRNAYELTGFGLDYVGGGIETTGADFLIVNRTRTDEINVYSTKSLIQGRLAEKNKFATTLSGI